MAEVEKQPEQEPASNQTADPSPVSGTGQQPQQKSVSCQDQDARDGNPASAEQSATPESGEKPKSKSGLPSTSGDIFDMSFKQILNMSFKTTIRAINALFHRNYALDSIVEDLGTETISGEGTKSISDYIFKITGTDTVTNEVREEAFLIEFMSYSDSSLVLRLFEYSFYRAWKDWKQTPRKRNDNIHIKFPAALELYLYEGPRMPNQLTLEVEFPDGTTHTYNAPVVKLLGNSFEENVEKFPFFIPFEILRYRELLKAARSPENVEKLKKHLVKIQNVIKDEYWNGNLNSYEATVLRDVLEKLFQYEYASKYKEMEGEKVMQRNWLNLEFSGRVKEIKEATDERDAACLEAKKAQERAEMAETRADGLASELAKARELILQLQSQGAQIQPS